MRLLFTALVLLICSLYNSEAHFQEQQVILTTIDGVRVRASRIGTGKDTILIYCHRLLSSKESFDQIGSESAFLREFDVLTFDFRGHSQSGWSSSCGGDEILDLRSVVLYARETGYQKIILLGVGMGGVVAIREATIFGNVDAVIAVNPCGQPDKLKPWWWNLAADVSLTTDYGRIPIRILNNTRVSDRYQTGSPINLVDRISPIPLLLIHNKADRYLNSEQIQALYDSSGEPKKLLILPQSKKGLFDEPTAELVIKWIRESLPSKTNHPDSPPPIQINEIDIQGDLVLPEEMLKKSIKASANRALNFQEQLALIKNEVENLHEIRGYTRSRVSRIDLSADGKLCLEVEVEKIDHLVIKGNRQLTPEQIKQSLQLADGLYYNAWEIENAVKKLSKLPIFENIENRLEHDENGNTVSILVKERRSISSGINIHFTEIDQFCGLQFSINEFRPDAWKVSSQILTGLQHWIPLYQINLSKGWFRDTISPGLGYEQFFHSWDDMDYYFARQGSKDRGGYISAVCKITDNTAIHLGVSRKLFARFDAEESLPVDSGFINALAARLENKGRFLRKSEPFFKWRSQIFTEAATARLHGDYDYKVLQVSFYPQFILSPKQVFSLGLHWGISRGDVPQQKLFSLGGDATLSAYKDDAFIGRRVFLLKARYDLMFGKWLDENSRLSPLGVSLMLDAGDMDSLKFESGIELNYSSLIRFGFVSGFEKKVYSIYFGWHHHLFRS